MDIRDMYYVAALDKHESIGKAADEVHVSQPAMSKFLKILCNPSNSYFEVINL